MTGGGSYDPGAASHRALREIRRELERHPAVVQARGFPQDTFSKVVANVEPVRLGIEGDDATLTVRWFAGETAADRPQFSVHYSDEAGRDFGWHHEPNPHVDGWGHYQERTERDGSYDYEPYSFSSHVPARVIWEVLSRLEERLQ